MVTGIFASTSVLKTLWHNDRRRFIHESLLIFLASGFLIPPRVWADIFYLLIFPASVYFFIWQKKISLFQYRVLTPIPISGLLITWFTLTLLWDQTSQSNGDVVNWAWSALCTLVYVFSLNDALQSQADFRNRLMQGLILAGMANIFISFVILLFNINIIWDVSGPLRMSGWSVTRAPILGAIILGLVVIMAIDRALVMKKRRFWVAAFFGLAFIAFTGSRGPEVAVLAAITVLLGLRRPWLLLKFVVGMLILLSLFAAFDWPLLYHFVAEQLARGDSHRFIIWRLSWHDIMQHAWIGYGPGYRLNSPPGEQFPHNLFLSTWLYTGLVGLVLLLIYLLKVLQSALSSPVKADRATNIAILLLLVVSAMTEFSQLIKGPGPMWYIFWLPTLLALSNGFCSHGCKCAPECESQLLL